MLSREDGEASQMPGSCAVETLRFAEDDGLTPMIRTVLIFGGRSAEHEVSILSARSVANAAPKQRLEIIPLCMARDGRFIGPERSARVLEGSERSDRGDDDSSFESWA